MPTVPAIISPHRQWLWQLTSAGWGHCGLAWASATVLPPWIQRAHTALPRRDQYSARRTSLLLSLLAYRQSLAPALAPPPAEGTHWAYQAWRTARTAPAAHR